MLKAFLYRLIDRIELKDPAWLGARLAAIEVFRESFPDILVRGDHSGQYYLQYQRYGIKSCIVYRTKKELLQHLSSLQSEQGLDESHWVRFHTEQSKPAVPYLFSGHHDLKQYQHFDRDLINAVLAVDWFCKTYGTEDLRAAPDPAIDAKVYHALRHRGVFETPRAKASADESRLPGWDWLWQSWELSQVLYELGIASGSELWRFSEAGSNPFGQANPDYVKTDEDLWRFDKTLEVLMAVMKRSSGGSVYTIADFDIQLIGRFRQVLPNLEARERFLDEMYHLGGHAVYSPEMMSQVLNACDIPCRVTDWSVIVFENVEIRITEPEWGKPGIYATDVVSAAIKRYGYTIESKMSGRGFRHRDLLSKLAAKWGIKRDYV
jgi:hypothetical protein